MRVRQGVAALLTAICLQGCTDWGLEWANRNGPAPAPTAAQASAAAQRELGVIAALAYVTDVTALPANGDSDAWMEVVLTGFNTVDDACSTYMNDLWRAERERNRANNVLMATGGAVAAIVGARTNPPGHTLAILAQAFSLSEAISNAVWESYLFSQNASTIRGLVKKTSDAYRNALQQKQVILRPTPAGAYYHVREYLSLCLPPTIQAQIEDHVAKAKAVGTAPGSSPSSPILESIGRQGTPPPRGAAAINIQLAR